MSKQAQIVSDTAACSNDPAAMVQQEEQIMARIKNPKHFVLRTGGGKQTYWVRFRHPLRNGKVVHKSTGIAPTDKEAANQFSNALATLIKSKAGWGERHKAIAKNKIVADFYYGLAIAPKDRPDTEITQDNDLGVVYVGELEDQDLEGESVPLTDALAARKKDRDAIARAIEERDSALIEIAKRDAEIDKLKAAIKDLENRIVASTGETAKAPPPFTELAKLYLAGLTGKGGKAVSPTHHRTRERHLQEFWPSILPSDIRLIEKPVIDAEIAKLGKTRTRKTAHTHLESIRAFMWWSVENGYIQKNPIEFIKSPGVKPTKKRSALSVADFHRLFKSTTVERKILYVVGVVTGYRKKELASLKVKDFNPENCTLTLSGDHTKNGDDAQQVLPVGVANLLAAWVRETERTPDDPLLVVSSHIDRYFKQDLGKVAEGRVCVFHSLRHSTATFLAAAGATQKEIMEWMRHSDPKLSLGQYAHVVEEKMRNLGETAFAGLLSA